MFSPFRRSWKPGSIRTYLTKKWSKIIKRDGKDLRVSGVSTYTTDEFVRLMSQKDEISAEPKKPQLKPEVEALLRKARESALGGDRRGDGYLRDLDGSG